MRLVHPDDTSHSIDVDDDHAGEYLSQGWREGRASPAKKTAAKRAPRKSATARTEPTDVPLDPPE